MNFFTSNGEIGIYPTGSISAYMGTTDPDGWVICNGIMRNDGQDGRYNNLIAAKIGVGTVNVNYTPPNLSNQFLRSGTNSSSINTGGGNDNVALTNNELPAHTHVVTNSPHSHAITDVEHGHGITDPGHSHYTNTYRKSDYKWSHRNSNDIVGGKEGSTNGNKWTDAANTTGITVNSATTGITTTNGITTGITLGASGSGAPFSIVPSYTTVNYIMKY